MIILSDTTSCNWLSSFLLSQILKDQQFILFPLVSTPNLYGLSICIKKTLKVISRKFVWWIDLQYISNFDDLYNLIIQTAFLTSLEILPNSDQRIQRRRFLKNFLKVHIVQKASPPWRPYYHNYVGGFYNPHKMLYKESHSRRRFNVFL